MAGSDVQPWERQDGESDESYEAFQNYLTTGSARSLARSAEAVGKSRQLLERWSSRDRWASRILAYDRKMAREITNRVVVGTAAMRERLALQGQNISTRAAKRILEMTEAEIKALSPSEVVAFARAGAMIEASARSVSAAELAAQEREDVPRFTIRFLEGVPDENVSVRLPDGTPGYIPADMIDSFKRDYPDAVVIA